MWCYKCGTQLPEGSSFCTRCGAQQPKNYGQVQQPPPVAPQPDYGQGAPPSYGQQAPPARPQQGYGQSAQPGYGEAAYQPQQSHYVRQQAQQYQGPPPTKPKSRTPLVLGLVAGGLAVVVLAAVLLINFVTRRGTRGSGDGAALIQPSSRPEVSSTAPASSAPPEDDGGLEWLIAPSLDYDELTPVGGGYEGGTTPYLNISKGGQTGTIDFATGKVIFELHEGYDLIVCEMGYSHYLPPDIEVLGSEDRMNRALTEQGFPFPTHGGHGGGDPITWLYNPADGSMTLGYFGMGSFYQPFEGGEIPQEYIPDVIQVISAEDMDEYGYIGDFDSVRYGLADRNGNLLLPVEYEEIVSPAASATHRWAIRKSGLWGYYASDIQRVVAECVYEPMWEYEYYSTPGYFVGEYCPVKQNGKVGYINALGQVVVEPQFVGGTHVYKNSAWVQQDGLWGQITILG